MIVLINKINRNFKNYGIQLYQNSLNYLIAEG
jgi:hypothetical protein